MHIFVITSILNPKVGVIDPETRYNQTLRTIESIKERAPGSMILLLDSSPELEQHKVDNLRSQVDYFISLSNHTLAMELATNGLKSPGECYIMAVAIDVIRNLAKLDVQRVFKITGRAELTDEFNIEDYNNPEMKNKYVFQEPVVSWMSQQIKLVNTRLWSFDYDMLDEVDNLVREAFEETMKGRFDLEHTYYMLIEDKDRIFGMERIGLKCQVASNGVMVNE